MVNTRPMSREDGTQSAFRVLQHVIDQTEDGQVSRKNPAAVALGRKGGLASARARMEKMSPERRSEIARKAARARWDKERLKPQ